MDNEFTFTDYKAKFMELYNGIERASADDYFLSFLEDNGYFTCPSSGGYHGAQEGGNLKHSVLVTEQMLKLRPVLCPELSEESCIITGLFHDLGKASFFDKPNYIPNLLKNGKPAAKPFSTNPDRLPIPHQTASAIILSKFIELTENELYAILYHNGLYTPDGRVIQGKETPLLMLLHFSDMWASRFLETGYKFENEGVMF